MAAIDSAQRSTIGQRGAEATKLRAIAQEAHIAEVRATNLARPVCTAPAHHWLIAPPTSGLTSPAICKHCGLARSFQNSFEPEFATNYERVLKI